jgi:hypothetical protein
LISSRSTARTPAEDEREHRQREDDQRLGRHADSEKYHDQRRQRDQRARIEHGHQWIERVADADAPAHDDAERNANDHSSRESVKERHGADEQVIRQRPGRQQIDEAFGDQVGFADEQRVEWHEQEYSLPSGEEQHDRKKAEQHISMLGGEAQAQHRCGLVRHGYTVISSLRLFQISSLSSLNSGVTRIS